MTEILLLAAEGLLVGALVLVVISALSRAVAPRPPRRR